MSQVNSRTSDILGGGGVGYVRFVSTHLGLCGELEVPTSSLLSSLVLLETIGRKSDALANQSEDYVRIQSAVVSRIYLSFGCSGEIRSSVRLERPDRHPLVLCEAFRCPVGLAGEYCEWVGCR